MRGPQLPTRNLAQRAPPQGRGEEVAGSGESLAGEGQPGCEEGPRRGGPGDEGSGEVAGRGGVKAALAPGVGEGQAGSC